MEQIPNLRLEAKPQPCPFHVFSSLLPSSIFLCPSSSSSYSLSLPLLSFVWVFLAWKIPYPACLLDLYYLDIKNISLLSVVDGLNIFLYFIFYDVLAIKIFHIINFINLFYLCLWTLYKVKIPHILFQGSCVCVCTPIVLLLLLFYI